MDLRKYKDNNKLTLQKIADLLGIEGTNPRRTVSRYISKTRTPRIEIAKKIVAMTDGEVSLTELGIRNEQHEG